jgi:CRP/FNR family transcriptional regulator
MNSPYGLPCVENCLSCPLRSGHFFCCLSHESLAAFNRIKHASVYPKHTVIFVEGQVQRGIFMLCQGTAKLSTTSKDGRVFILRIAQAGEVLGLHATITGKAYELTVETMQPCQLNFASREDFLPFLREHADASLAATRHISREYQEAFAVIRSVGLTHSISEKLARFLLESSRGATRASLPLTHQDIGQLIVTSQETITRTLSEFRKRKLPSSRGAH